MRSQSLNPTLVDSPVTGAVFPTFVPGETVRLVTRAPLGGDPLLVQAGFTRFAMRRQEAARVKLQVPSA